MSPALLLRTQLEALRQKLEIAKGYPEAHRPIIRETKGLIREYSDALKLLAGESIEVRHDLPKTDKLRGLPLDLGFTFAEVRKGAIKAGHGFDGALPFLWVEEPDKGADLRPATFFLTASESTRPPEGYPLLSVMHKGVNQYFLYGLTEEGWRV